MQNKEDKTMERISIGALCLLLPAAVLAIMLIGYGIFNALLNTINPFEAWADARIDEYEKGMYEDDESKYSEDK